MVLIGYVRWSLWDVFTAHGYYRICGFGSGCGSFAIGLGCMCGCAVSSCVCVCMCARACLMTSSMIAFLSCYGTPWLCFSTVLFHDFIFTIVPLPPRLQIKHCVCVCVYPLLTVVLISIIKSNLRLCNRKYGNNTDGLTAAHTRHFLLKYAKLLRIFCPKDERPPGRNQFFGSPKQLSAVECQVAAPKQA